MVLTSQEYDNSFLRLQLLLFLAVKCDMWFSWGTFHNPFLLSTTSALDDLRQQLSVDMANDFN